MMAIDSGAGIHVEVVAPPTPAVVVMFTWIVAHTSFMGTAVVTAEVKSTYHANNNAGGGMGGNAYNNHDTPSNQSGASALGNDTHGSASGGGNGSGSSLKPICKVYRVLEFIRFLDCYNLTLITKRANVGSIGGNSIHTIKVSDN